MRVSVGVFAHNEERSIARVVEAIAKQDAWHALVSRGLRAELLVLANGCRDSTAARAAEAAAAHQTAGLAIRVLDLAEPGKSRTWNRFVHESSARDAEFLIFCDGDIELPDPGTFRSLLEFLESHPDVMVSTSRPTKDLELRRPRGPMESLSRSVATLSQGVARHAIAGSLYCARRRLVDTVEMPIGLLGEDGFMRLASATLGFAAEPVDARIERVPGARHVFKPCATAREYLNHERRLVMGTVQNFAVWNWIRSLPPSESVQLEIRRRNQAEPGWSLDLMRSDFRRLGRRRLLRKVVDARAEEWSMHRWGKRALLLPAVCAKTALGCLATLRAYNQAASGNIRW